MTAAPAGPRRLVHIGVPPRLEALKDHLGAAIPLGGAQVAQAAMAEAMLRYRPIEEICFVPGGTAPLARARDLLAEYGHPGATVVSPEEIASHPGRSLIFQNSPRLFEASGLRSLLGKPDWPVVGVTHSLSIADGAMAALHGVLPSGFVAPFDRLICTSMAGQRAFLAMQAQALRSLGNAVSGNAGPAHASPPGTGILTEVIPLGVDAERYAPDRTPAPRTELAWLRMRPGEVVFLYCGRLSAEYKMDPFPLIATFAAAFRGQRGVRLILAGDSAGGAHARVPATAAALGIGDQVTVVPDPSAAVKLRLYQVADVFVSFADNLQETFGLSVIEAMSCGLPVIAADWSGFAETVASGETGFLLPTTWCRPDEYSSRVAVFSREADAHLGLAQEVSVDTRGAVTAMRRLASLPALRRELGDQARQRVLRRYAWPVVMAAYRELFRRLLDCADRSSAGGAGRAIGYPPFSYDHVAVFGHYATRVTGLPEVVELIPEGERYRAVAIREAFAAGLGAGTGAATAPSAAQVLACCLPGGRASSTALIGSLAVEVGDRRAAIRVVQLLLKYGVLAASRCPAP
jgi:glycosyltransferase involved in cell wall biosynthesis